MSIYKGSRRAGVPKPLALLQSTIHLHNRSGTPCSSSHLTWPRFTSLFVACLSWREQSGGGGSKRETYRVFQNNLIFLMGFSPSKGDGLVGLLLWHVLKHPVESTTRVQREEGGFLSSQPSGQQSTSTLHIEKSKSSLIRSLVSKTRICIYLDNS